MVKHLSSKQEMQFDSDISLKPEIEQISLEAYRKVKFKNFCLMKNGQVANTGSGISLQN